MCVSGKRGRAVRTGYEREPAHPSHRGGRRKAFPSQIHAKLYQLCVLLLFIQSNRSAQPPRVGDRRRASRACMRRISAASEHRESVHAANP